MSETLEKRLYAATDADLVADFECGVRPWEIAQALWISGSSVLQSIENHKTEVWLYFNSANDLVGFGSIGKSRRPHPPNSKNLSHFSIIPALAVKRQFWGKPNDGIKFSEQILDHLVDRAKEHGTEQLILDVHVQNTHAERLYREYGFSDYFDHVKDEHRRLVVRLR